MCVHRTTITTDFLPFYLCGRKAKGKSYASINTTLLSANHFKQYQKRRMVGIIEIASLLLVDKNKEPERERDEKRWYLPLCLYVHHIIYE